MWTKSGNSSLCSSFWMQRCLVNFHQTHQLLRPALPHLPCAGSSGWEECCPESSSWLWAAARWSTAALRPPSLWPWCPETRYPPAERQVGQRRKGSDKPQSRRRSLTSGPYGSLEISSGAIQYGVPTRDFLLCTSLDTWAQKPKSDSFTCRQTRGDPPATTGFGRKSFRFSPALDLD